MTVRLQAKSFEDFLYVTGLLGEAGVEWQAGGGNELNVPDDVYDRLDAEQRRELSGALTNGVQVTEDPSPATPPGADDGTEGNAGPEVASAPPRSGAGATRDAWAAYATATGADVPEDMSRDDIIAMIDQQEAHGGS